MTTEEAVIYLTSCAVNEEIPEKKLISEINPEKVLTFAQSHKISCCVAMALESAGIKNIETSKAIAQAIRRNALFDNSLEEVTAKLDEAGIWYVPLKGIILKKYYPKPFMREMADHDILIDASRAADVKEIMEELGFSTKLFGKMHHDIYFKKPALNYEMHTSLFSPRSHPMIYEYYRGRNELSRAEDFYIYLIAHEYKHFFRYGTGLRSLLDIYLYLNKETLDWEYVEKQVERLGIQEFERNNRSLSVNLFENGDVTDEQMLTDMLLSGTYGSVAHKVENEINKTGGNRVLYMLKRFYIPIRTSNPEYPLYSAMYPKFYKCKILLPLLPFYRVFHSVKSGKFMTEWRTIFNYRKNDNC